MRTKDEPQIFPAAKCCVGSRCGLLWTTWCRGCNLVYCETHAARTLHECPSRDKRPQVVGALPPDDPGPVERGFGEPAAPPQEEAAHPRNDKILLHPNEGNNGSALA